MKLATIFLAWAITFSIPTLAASTAIVDNQNIIVGSTIGYTSDEIVPDDALKLYIETLVPYENQEFLVSGTDIKFDENIYSQLEAETGVVVTRLNDYTVRVSVGQTGDLFVVPLYVEITGNSPVLIIEGNGGISSQTIKLSDGELADAPIQVEFGNIKNISASGKGVISDITISEMLAGALNIDGGTDVEISIKAMPNLGFDVKVGDEVSLYGTTGLAGNIATATVKSISSDTQTIIVNISQTNQANIRGALTLQNIPVGLIDRQVLLPERAIEVDVAVHATAATGVVGQITDTGLQIGVEENLILSAGETTDVTVTMEEMTAGSLSRNQTIYVSAEGLNILSVEETVTDGVQISPKTGRTGDIEEIELRVTTAFDTNLANKITFTFEAQVQNNYSGDITIVAESRDFETVQEVVVGEVVEIFKSNFVGAEIRVGYRNQIGGQITLAEISPESLQKDKQIVIDIDNSYGVTIESANVVATNGLQLDTKIVDGAIVITILSDSYDVSSISISDIAFTANNSASEGYYDLRIGGSALSMVNKSATSGSLNESMKHAVVAKDFLKVGTKNTYRNIEAMLNIKTGEASLNGTSVELVTTPYITDDNRTMVGVRDLVTMFEIPDDSINVVGSTVTIVSDDNVVQLTNGSREMLLNGTQITMDGEMQIVDGRTYVPVRYIAQAFGLNVSFSGDTITFKNF
ncbi:MAG: hypothetical protein ATN35_00065 [Epulopiscium sp. Nele67-Bin004]|nr:MAG: hypothetical protein ATN35_00065 [Epulopiscium sp. Nele67-Bin004]